MNTDAQLYVWIDFYCELADKLLQFRNKRAELIEVISNAFHNAGQKRPKLEADGYPLKDIDPFTVFGFFNKGLTNSNRIRIARAFADLLGIKAAVPTSFEGIPVLNNQKATYYAFIGNRGEDDIENLWGIYEAAIRFVDEQGEESRSNFIYYFNVCQKQLSVRWNLTMGLYWIRPQFYLSLDSRNRWYITEYKPFSADFLSMMKACKDGVPDAADYLSISEKIRQELQINNTPCGSSIPEFSHYAWQVSEKVNKEKKEEKSEYQTSDVQAIPNSREKRYWLYQPGPSADHWEEFYEKDIMALAWGNTGDLTLFNSKTDMLSKLAECYPDGSSHKNDALAIWQFSKEMQPGDVIIVKKGLHKIIGMGIVTSEYTYDEEIEDSYKHTRSVDWTHKGEWEHVRQAAVKTLTNISQYNGYVKELLALFDEEEEQQSEEIATYASEDFLNEVFMARRDYEKLAGLLRYKKNVILQGAPGVGKTFAAKRLAYSLMGKQDDARVLLIQFHQSYSYEDFIIGLRPTEQGGFKLQHGSFYDFCKLADSDRDNDYYLIIDEINRGNLSKIFGELFMLLECDKRDTSIRLLYEDERFAIPDNVYIIGMMNTADRSLALLDFALRRRFGFFELTPAFASEGFIHYQSILRNPRFDALISTVRELNLEIEKDDTLGRGFCIGHSYFCHKPEHINTERLEAIVHYELIPLLEEYWFDAPEKVCNWSQRLAACIQ